MSIHSDLTDKLIMNHLGKMNANKGYAQQGEIFTPSFEVAQAGNALGTFNAGLQTAFQNLGQGLVFGAQQEQATVDQINSLKAMAWKDQQLKQKQEFDAEQAQLDRDLRKFLATSTPSQNKARFELKQMETVNADKIAKQGIVNSLMSPEMIGKPARELLAHARKQKGYKKEFDSDILSMVKGSKESLLSQNKPLAKQLSLINEQEELAKANIGKHLTDYNNEMRSQLMEQGFNPDFIARYQEDIAAGNTKASQIDDLLSKVGADEEPLYGNRAQLQKLYGQLEKEFNFAAPDGLLGEIAARLADNDFIDVGDPDINSDKAQQLIADYKSKYGFGDSDFTSKVKKLKEGWRTGIAGMAEWSRTAQKEAQETYQKARDTANTKTLKNLAGGEYQKYNAPPVWGTTFQGTPQTTKENVSSIVKAAFGEKEQPQIVPNVEDIEEVVEEPVKSSGSIQRASRRGQQRTEPLFDIAKALDDRGKEITQQREAKLMRLLEKQESGRILTSSDKRNIRILKNQLNKD